MKREKIIAHYPLDWSPEKIQAFRRDLLTWYDQEKRDLPWRRTQDPYHIWVSEVMLQQTQVDTVIPYYERFLEALPTIQDLAAAEEGTLMKLWQGLGYYSRVRNMQTAAQQIVRDYGGQMPGQLEDLLSLKGIGPYTAGAIASIAFGLDEPAIDGNLMRVLARLFEIDGDITRVGTQRIFQALMYQLIDPDRPGDFNQALMDLGATIMTPTNYQPLDSPLLAYDQSNQHGTADRYPVKKAKTKVTEHHYLAYWLTDTEGRWCFRQHGSDELLQGLWHFPLVEAELDLGAASDQELLEPLTDHLAEFGISGAPETFELAPDLKKPAPRQAWLETMTVKHIFSHRIWQVTLLSVRYTDEPPANQVYETTETYQTESGAQARWLVPQEIDSLAISTLQHKLLQLIDSSRLG